MQKLIFNFIFFVLIGIVAIHPQDFSLKNKDGIYYGFNTEKNYRKLKVDIKKFPKDVFASQDNTILLFEAMKEYIHIAQFDGFAILYNSLKRIECKNDIPKKIVLEDPLKSFSSLASCQEIQAEVIAYYKKIESMYPDKMDAAQKNNNFALNYNYENYILYDIKFRINIIFQFPIQFKIKTFQKDSSEKSIIYYYEWFSDKHQGKLFLEYFLDLAFFDTQNYFFIWMTRIGKDKMPELKDYPIWLVEPPKKLVNAKRFELKGKETSLNWVAYKLHNRGFFLSTMGYIPEIMMESRL